MINLLLLALLTIGNTYCYAALRGLQDSASAAMDCMGDSEALMANSLELINAFQKLSESMSSDIKALEKNISPSDELTNSVKLACVDAGGIAIDLPNTYLSCEMSDTELDYSFLNDVGCVAASCEMLYASETLAEMTTKMTAQKTAQARIEKMAEFGMNCDVRAPPADLPADSPADSLANYPSKECLEDEGALMATSPQLVGAFTELFGSFNVDASEVSFTDDGGLQMSLSAPDEGKNSFEQVCVDAGGITINLPDSFLYCDVEGIEIKFSMLNMADCIAASCQTFDTSEVTAQKQVQVMTILGFNDCRLSD